MLNKGTEISERGKKSLHIFINIFFFFIPRIIVLGLSSCTCAIFYEENYQPYHITPPHIFIYAEEQDWVTEMSKYWKVFLALQFFLNQKVQIFLFQYKCGEGIRASLCILICNALCLILLLVNEVSKFINTNWGFRLVPLWILKLILK